MMNPNLLTSVARQEPPDIAFSFPPIGGREAVALWIPLGAQKLFIPPPCAETRT